MAAFSKLRFEKSLPITLSAYTTLLFIFGLCGKLAIGIYFLCIAAGLMYAVSLIHVVRTRSFRLFQQTLMSPAFFFFVILFIALSILNAGQLCFNWDEFSHWGDSVKAMAHIDDLITNPASASVFQSYPPGMALFQYMVEKIRSLVEGASPFCEWRLYFSFQIFLLSFFFPFLDRLSIRQPFRSLVALMGFGLSPLFLFPNVYSDLGIDPFLSVLTGCGFASIFLRQTDEEFGRLRLFMTVFILVLAKDAGLFFAAFLSLAFFLDSSLKNRRLMAKDGLLILAAVVIPKLLWSFNVRISHANIVFSGKFDWQTLLYVLSGSDTSYRTLTLTRFWNTFLRVPTPIGTASIGLGLPFSVILLLLFLLLYLLYRLYAQKEPSQKAGRKAICLTLLTAVILYVLGLNITYLFKFSEYEALKLASFDRYLGIAFSAVWIMITLLSLSFIQQSTLKPSRLMAAVLSLLLILTTSWGSVAVFVSRYAVKYSISVRSPYFNICNRASSIAPDQSKRFFIISQNTSGFDYWNIRFNLRPNTVNPVFSWCIKPPPVENKLWVTERTTEEWREELIKDYDYVIIYGLDTAFSKTYSPLFADPLNIRANAIYRVNKNVGLLELCSLPE